MDGLGTHSSMDELRGLRIQIKGLEAMIEARDKVIREVDDERAAVAGYLIRNVLRPNGASPLGDLMGICTQVDHIVATKRNQALEDAANVCCGKAEEMLVAGDGSHTVAMLANQIFAWASEIRALKEQGE